MGRGYTITSRIIPEYHKSPATTINTQARSANHLVVGQFDYQPQGKGSLVRTSRLVPAGIIFETLMAEGQIRAEQHEHCS
jgi:hypothetical protein